jgi:uncharacterized membrane protein YeiH
MRIEKPTLRVSNNLQELAVLDRFTTNLGGFVRNLLDNRMHFVLKPTLVTFSMCLVGVVYFRRIHFAWFKTIH